MDETDELIQELRESARYLEMRGIDRGCQDSSISAGLANRAADTIEALAKPASSPAGGDVEEREVAAQAALARIKKLRDQYADQAKFADVDEARLFRQFVERLDRAALSQSTSAGRVGE